MSSESRVGRGHAVINLSVIESYAMSSHFKDQIHRLTAIINSAVGRKKTDAIQSETSIPQTEKKSRQDIEYQRLGEMILKMQDERLDQRYISRLGKWLSCDEQALRYYVEFNQLSAMLRMFYSNKQKMTEEFFLARN
ncbi:MAG: hypothetical protein FVQ82_01465 [Planctomycetes bacterium]|nr:hypothetical protein [Planctomycetota bacterium]